MSSIGYYENLIDECNMRIRKYEAQIEGLKSFDKENANGAETFMSVTAQRRGRIDTSLVDKVNNPMVKKLHNKIYNAIDKEYENAVLDNFDEVKDEISKAINKLKNKIDEEKTRIAGYRRTIAEIREEERREAERREAERRAAEREKQTVK